MKCVFVHLCEAEASRDSAFPNWKVGNEETITPLLVLCPTIFQLCEAEALRDSAFPTGKLGTRKTSLLPLSSGRQLCEAEASRDSAFPNWSLGMRISLYSQSPFQETPRRRMIIKTSPLPLSSRRQLCEAEASRDSAFPNWSLGMRISLYSQSPFQETPRRRMDSAET